MLFLGIKPCPASLTHYSSDFGGKHQEQFTIRFNSEACIININPLSVWTWYFWSNIVLLKLKTNKIFFKGDSTLRIIIFFGFGVLRDFHSVCAIACIPWRILVGWWWWTSSSYQNFKMFGTMERPSQQIPFHLKVQPKSVRQKAIFFLFFLLTDPV